MNRFEYHRPATVADAVAIATSAAEGRLLAGGQTLLPAMKLGLSAPTDLIDLAQIPGLRGVSRQGERVRVGAMTTHAEVARSPLVRSALPALAELAGGIGDPQVRARGTLGGSLANNDPAACYPSAVLALDAIVHTQQRDIAADDFFTGLYATALEVGEVIEAVSFPIPQVAAYEKFLQPASHFALVGVFVARLHDRVRVAVTGAASCVFRVPALEHALAADWSAASCQTVTVAADLLNNDLHASAAYRAHLIPVLAGRAVQRAR